MPYCADSVLTTSDGRNKLAVTLFCMNWHCELCVQKRQQILYRKVISGEPTRFITLTRRRRPGVSKQQHAEGIRDTWALFFRREVKRHSERPEFLGVWEPHPTSGWPHAHIAYRGPWIDQRELSEFFVKHLDSPFQDIRFIHDREKRAAYVSGYCTKAPVKFGTLNRYWKSRGYEPEPPPPRFEPRQWDRQHMTLTRWMDAWRDFGWSVQLDESGLKATASPPS